MRCLLLLATCAATACFAHESPEHRVAELSSEMALAGKSGSALMQRAIEYRALGALDEAAGDLEAVLQLEPQSLDALKTLSEIQSEQGKTGLALQTIGRAIRLNPQDASLYFTRAVIYGGDGKDEAALTDCERAFAGHKGDLEWYLTRAQLQSRLGRFNECIAGLNEGLKLTGSAVLNVELIEALIDARKYHEALARIEPELKDTRLRSAWLLRRARVRLGLGKNSAAKQDLSAALEELNQRISPHAPDVTLLVERGMVLALSQQLLAARSDLARALQAGAEPWLVWRLERLLAHPRHDSSPSVKSNFSRPLKRTVRFPVHAPGRS
jgi:tetratricopeptide (TPR) repeat protein